MSSPDREPRNDRWAMRSEADTEICNLCGRSVAFGSGWFVNRVPDLDTPSERRANGRQYPEGDWICAECDGWCPDCDGRHEE